MRSFAVLLPLLALTPSVLGQNLTFLTGLLTSLSNAGLSHLVTVAASLNGTAQGQQLLANISNGSPHLIFAPNDNAWSLAPSNITGNQTLLGDVFSYHIVPGNFSQASTVFPNVTLGETLLNDPSSVQLEGGKSQVVAWSIRADNKTHVLNQLNDTTVLNITTFENITVLIVDHVLGVPESLNVTVTRNSNISAFQTVLESATLAFYNSSTNATSDITFLDAFDAGYHGFTLFAPSNAAVTAANSTLQGFAGNRTAINAVLFNHAINGTTIYSPLLTGSQSYTTMAGETLSFSINATGQYVTSGNITAKIVQPDVLLDNGVLHIIDTVLINTDSDASKASSALSSATSAATAAHSQTAPIGFSVTQSLGGPSGTGGSSSASSTSGSNAARSTLNGMGTEKTLGLLTAVVGVAVGGLFVMF